MKGLIKYRSFIITIISYLFALLFLYAAISKLLDFENFRIQLAQSPLLTAYAGFIAPAVITVEIITALLLLIKPLRIPGLYISLFLMASFIVYIYIILHYTEFIPCSCGGIIEKLGWNGHLVFNTVFLGFAVAGILIGEKHKRKPLFTALILLAVICTATACVGYLFRTSEYIIKKENNFTRRFIPHAIEVDRVLNLNANSYYFAGMDESHIYLGNKTAPLLLTCIDSSLLRKNTDTLQLENPHYSFRVLSIKIKPPFYYVWDGSVPIVFRGRLGQVKSRRISYKDAYFSEFEPVDSTSYIFRTQSVRTRKNELGKASLAPLNNTHIRYGLLKSDKDGIFDNDGQLIQDYASNRFLYIHYYKNTIMCFDADLNLISTFHTLDTITKPQIKLARQKNGLYKMAEPPLTVNKRAYAFKNIVLIQSGLKGKYESDDIWEYADVIDIYRTDEQNYLGSFFVEHRGGDKLSGIMLADNYLFVLSGNELIRYRIAQPVKDKFKWGKPKTHTKE